MPPLEEGYKKNFQTLLDAAKAEDLCLADCRNKVTGKPVRVVCAVNRRKSDVELAPLAMLFDGDPSDELDPPGYDEEGKEQETTECEFLVARDDGTWGAIVREVPFGPHASLDALVEWADQNMAQVGYKDTAHIAVCCFPFVTNDYGEEEGP